MSAQELNYYDFAEDDYISSKNLEKANGQI